MTWSGGITCWVECNTAYISVAFTWKIPEAVEMAQFEAAQGRAVRVGGPGVFLKALHKHFDGLAQVGGDYPDAVRHHNPDATFASRGCPVGCSFCIVPAMEGRKFTPLPDFTPRPVLCDNNLSGLPLDYQQHIINRYQSSGVPLRDANSGFEPKTFTPDVYALWKPLINAGRGPWRFAFDEQGEREDVLRVMDMLADEPQKRKRVYVLIGNEPFDSCVDRVRTVIDRGCEPHVQPVMRLNTLDRRPWIKNGWTEKQLKDLARWANRWLWKTIPFDAYAGAIKSSQPDDTEDMVYALSKESEADNEHRV